MWVRDLVQAEQAMEESGVVDIATAGGGLQLQEESIEFLRDLKAAFLASVSAFNQYKNTNTGTVKIYGIAKTHADFMLFRNGFKLIFSMQAPGEIHIYYSHMGSQGTGTAAFTDVVKAQTRAFDDLVWVYENQEIKLDHMVRYYLTRFVRESAR